MTTPCLTDIFKRRAPEAQATGAKRTVNWTAASELSTDCAKTATVE